MDAAIIVTWSEPIPGREKQALAYAAESNEYWGKLAAEGKCSAPEWFLFGGGHGLWIVKGDRDPLLALFMGPQSQRLSTKGELLLQGYTCEFAQTGSAVDAHLRDYAGVGKELALM